MKTTTFLTAALLAGASLLALAPTVAAFDSCVGAVDGCGYVVCIGYSHGSGYERCSLGVEDRGPCPGPFCEPAETRICTMIKGDCGSYAACFGYNQYMGTCQVGVPKSWLYCPGSPFCLDPR